MAIDSFPISIEGYFGRLAEGWIRRDIYVLQAIYGLALALAVNIYCFSKRIFFVATYNTIS